MSLTVFQMESFQPSNTNELTVQVAKSALYSVQIFLEPLNNVQPNNQLLRELYNRLANIQNIDYSERWSNFGIGWAYIGSNICGTVLMYYNFRIRRWNLTSLVRGVRQGASFLCRVFKRRSGKTPRGKEAKNGGCFRHVDCLSISQISEIWSLSLT